MGRQRDRGSALVTVMILAVVLLAGGAVLLGMQIRSTRSTGIVSEGLGALNCAESALAAARPLVAANVASWNTSLCNPTPPRGTGTCDVASPTSEPGWLSTLQHDIDGDGVNDIVITLVDNDDEVALDPLTDADSTIYIVATCKLRESRVQLMELVKRDAATGALTRKLWLRTE